jgi:hypothetical protein
MAQEPDNLVLTLLREIRATLAEQSTVLAAHTIQLTDIDKKFDDQKYLMTHTFGVAGMANVQSGLVETKVEQLSTRQKASEAKQVELERRLARVEEKV